jgi:beta-galactosidase
MRSSIRSGRLGRSISRVIALVILVAVTPPVGAQTSAKPAAVREVQPLAAGWLFVQDDSLTDGAALASTGEGWQSVVLPHTWNAADAATTNAKVPYKRGIGWYRLVFDTPRGGARHWLEFEAASIVADVWLNGIKLGQHKGAFTAFRFDATSVLRQAGNVLLVKTDNRAAKTDADVTAIAPLSGDFNMSGGLYRMVNLVSTKTGVHVALDDFGGSGVYATTRAIGPPATVKVRVKVVNDGASGGTYAVHTGLVDTGGHVVADGRTSVTLAPGIHAEAEQDLAVRAPRLWQGISDPYLYTLRVDLLDARGAPVDEVSQGFGIRQMAFDPDRGFSLNGRPLPLHGVAMHQDVLGKGWAKSDQDTDASMAIVKEIGANTLRLAHYPHAQHTLQRADEMGLVVWAEVPFVNGVRQSCSNEPATPEFSVNAEQQLRELIRQQYNHPSVAMWSVGNENKMQQARCDGADNVTPVLRRLHEVAKAEDPGRSTTLADDLSSGPGAAKISVGGITDIWGLNRYHMWYYGDIDSLIVDIDGLHAKYPAQPVGISEYGAGGAISDHTDNPLGGPPTPYGSGDTRVYQPEEYAAFVHERNYAVLASRPFIWGTYVWAMFDFGSGIRYEGDVRGVNTKGLVTFDRQTRKDPFYFYKAHWSAEPVTYIVGRRYTDRAYSTTDVKVYSNAETVRLEVNGTAHGTLTAAQCPQKTCVFEGVGLRPGKNVIAARGTRGTVTSADEVVWTWSDRGRVGIAAGQLVTGLRAADGTTYGSDNFFTGGVGRKSVQQTRRPQGDVAPIGGLVAPADAELYAAFREGRFRYDIPLANGNYRLVLGFMEPSKDTVAGGRVFDVDVNGTTAIRGFDVLREAGAPRTVVTKTLRVTVSAGRLRVEFRPLAGDALVSTLTITRE